MRIIDVSDPENPGEVSLFDTPDLPQGLFIAVEYAYIADRRSLQKAKELGFSRAQEALDLLR